jgi:hypothetical protein
MEVTLDVRDVKDIQLSELHESKDYFWRELTIKTAQGELRISLYTRDTSNEDVLKVKA